MHSITEGRVTVLFCAHVLGYMHNRKCISTTVQLSASRSQKAGLPQVSRKSNPVSPFKNKEPVTEMLLCICFFLLDSTQGTDGGHKNGARKAKACANTSD